MKNSKLKSALVLLLTLCIIAGSCVVVAIGIGKRHSGSAKNIQQGLDLKGGVSITFEIKNDEFTKKEFNDTIRKLQMRVDAFSTESLVYKEGDNRICVDVPGQTDAKTVLDDLGKPGSLYFVTDVTSEYKEGESDYEVHKVKGIDGKETIYRIWLDGNDIADAKGNVQADKDTQKKEYVVNLEMTKEGTKKFADATRENLNKPIGILYDDELVSNPTVNSVITEGSAVIEGQESLEEAEHLASTIRIGSLSLELKEMSHRVVSAKLGSDALSKSMKAGAIGIAIVILFMLIVYRLPGLVAGLCLTAYTASILLVLNAYNLTLSLSGIAGIILSIGMAVDANVIIYARIREEIAAGRDVGASIDLGFKKAASAILDGNITTIIAAFVLMWKGSGTIKGFAQTLAIGIALSMFTSLVIARILVKALYNLGLKAPGLYGKERHRKVFDFVSKRGICIALSVIVVGVGVAFMAINANKGEGPFYFSIEFKGGQSTTVEFNKDYTVDEFNDKIKPAVAKAIGSDDVQGQKEVNSNSYVIKTSELTDEKFDAMKKTLKDEFGAIDSDDNFDDTFISATVGDEMRKDAVVATVLATICMLIYIWFRFKDLKFALSAVTALVHDVLVVIAFYAISRTIVGTTFIACMLTIVGYSINATIVIFDRIRENLTLNTEKNIDYKAIVNKSITQTLTRSIYTSLTTFVTIAMIYVMGVNSIREFALPMMVGIICGAYSSVCITGSLWYMMKTGGKKGDAKKVTTKKETTKEVVKEA
ncbi:protein translocase subunit SecD [Eubacterium sp.]|uniref:protein translocase subunit SecD n=1 Tax=Eubacterium sp. TaxID=142586 RepID=UPI0025E41EAB|nr:protein translocase subunit SecD [Eubacterium sp.]MCR5630193.1 protein translocase subunit SecD [Eubacterium sp.]